MKFGKSLSNQIEETLPEWRDKFLSYKELKKRLKLVEPKKKKNDDDNNSNQVAGVGGAVNGDEVSAAAKAGAEEVRLSKKPRLDSGAAVGEKMTEAEIDFVKLLEDELEKFNSFFVEQEEEYVIRLKELQDRVAKAKYSSDEMIKIRKEIVDLHGEMVLLENYSALNYTGLVKILKKYDKRTGALLRLPFIQKVLQQPFFTTDLLYKLVKECERMLDNLFPVIDTSVTETAEENEPSSTATAKEERLLTGPKELPEIEYMESFYLKSTLSALRVLKEIRSGSSTVSVFSLPPLQSGGIEEQWNKVPILEQVAK